MHRLDVAGVRLGRLVDEPPGAGDRGLELRGVVGGDPARVGVIGPEFRVRGEAHAWSPETVATLQHAVRGNSRDKYRAFAKILNEQAEKILTIRGLFRIKSAEEDGRTPVPLDEVEPAKEIVKRFATGAMSYGSISREAHTTLAIAGSIQEFPV